MLTLPFDISRITAVGTVHFDGGPRTDPHSCEPVDCGDASTSGGDYRLASTSSCLPSNNPWGELIGALFEGCSQPGYRRVSWGGLKQLFRQEPE